MTTMDSAPRLTDTSADLLSSLPSYPTSKEDWASSPTRVTRRHSRVLSPTSLASGPSPKMRLVPLHEDSQANAGEAPSSSRGRSFSLAKVFGSKKSNKERSASVDPVSTIPPRPAPSQQRSPSALPSLPSASTIVDDTDPQAAIRRLEYARQLHTASAGTSYLPTHSQAPMYRHRVNQPFQPSARFAAAISVGFSPAQANAILAVAAPPMTPHTKYGMPRLPRGTLSPEKLLYLDWALNYVANERGQQDAGARPEVEQETSDPFRSRQRYTQSQLPSDPATGSIAVAPKGNHMETADASSMLGLHKGSVEDSREPGVWQTSAASADQQENSAVPAGWISSTSSSSAYLSATSLALPGPQEYRPRLCASSRSDSADSCPSSSNSHIQARILADLASDEGTGSESSCEETNETEILLDEQDMQVSKDARAKHFSVDVPHADSRAGRRRSSVMSGILGTVTSPVAQNIGFPNVASTTPPKIGLLGPSSVDENAACLAPLGPSLASPSTSSDSTFLRRPSWTFVGRRTSVSQTARAFGSLLEAGGDSQGDSYDTTSRTSCEPYRASEPAPSADKNGSTIAGSPRWSPRPRLLSLGQAKNRLEQALLGIPAPGPK
ncbi:hypothetical protein BCV69DRAFT_297282 [Microstroma glucosiphilum]|uniref:Uncharacterized protein n=1 Tax=Pseudomicrostroma glucosiphilum TaxID=1684307 RepID=A0A316UHD1_9BASI|nr:hypothetical protein BCV69DRAFT_297282 [Pseudomicrostroma glucosiphilum]PWN23343.1 hypothetical protein BCV69DRAFT_297282 [Pseudomicrostroma glucosiphilum]